MLLAYLNVSDNPIYCLTLLSIKLSIILKYVSRLAFYSCLLFSSRRWRPLNTFLSMKLFVDLFLSLFNFLSWVFIFDIFFIFS